MQAETERLKLLLVESGTAVGGTERVLWELATRLSPARWDVRVWLSPAPGVDEFAGALKDHDIPVARVAEVDSRWDWAGMLRTWRWFGRERMGEYNRRRFLETMAWEYSSAELLRAYQTLCRPKPRV
jgi:hypothetical protein